MQIQNNPQINFKGAIKIPYSKMLANMGIGEFSTNNDKIIRAGKDINFFYSDDSTEKSIIETLKEFNVQSFISHKVSNPEDFKKFSELDVFG